jgi:predicted xylose isomerase-like sugar epimerase
MTTWFYGGTRGMKNRTGDLTVGAATVGNSVDVEVRVNALDAQGNKMTKKDVVQILELVEDFFEQNGIPGNLGANLPPL